MTEVSPIAAIAVWIFCFCPIGLAFIAALGGVAYFMNRSDPKTDAAFQRASEALGLTFVSHRIGYPHLEGEIDGRAVKVNATRGRYGDLESGSGSRAALTGYNVSHGRSEIGWMSFQRRKKTSVTLRKETLLGDAEFDEVYAVYTSHPDIAREIVSDSDLRERFLNLQGTMISISESKVSVVDYGVQQDPDIMQERIQLALDIAERVDSLENTTEVE